MWDRLFVSVDRQDSLDRVGDPLEPTVKNGYKAAGPAGRRRLISCTESGWGISCTLL
jgi:hypothetical protein